MARRDILDGAKVREIKKNRKKASRLKLYLALFLFVSLVVGLAFLSRNHKLLINKVNISGNNVIATEDLLAIAEGKLAGNYLFVFPKKNIFLFPGNGIEKEILSAYKRIYEAKTRIDSLTEVSISVKEREGKYLWCEPETTENSKCYFMDKEGYLFDESPNFSGNGYFKFFGVFLEPDQKIGEYLLPKEEFARLSKFYESLAQIVSPVKLVSLDILDNGEYKFSIEGTEGKIIFKKDNNFDKLLENFGSALSSDPLKTDFRSKLKTLNYIDLRFDNKVYFKFN